MSRPFKFTLAALALLLSLTAIIYLGYRPGPPERMKEVLSGYLAYRVASGAGSATVQRMVHATRPWAFERAMSVATFGIGPYYGTTYSDGPARVAPSRTVPTPGSSGPPQVGQSGRLMPYPPVELWCVLLSAGDAATPAVVFVAQHQDLYNADWILHEPAASWGTAELSAILSAVDGDLGSSAP